VLWNEFLSALESPAAEEEESLALASVQPVPFLQRGAAYPLSDLPLLEPSLPKHRRRRQEALSI